MEDTCNAVSTDEDIREYSNEDVEAVQPIPTFWEAVAGFQTERWYLTSLPIDDASMQRQTQMEKEFFFICHTCPTKQTTLLRLFQEVTNLGMHYFHTLFP
jgi:hypothetical protein